MSFVPIDTDDLLGFIYYHFLPMLKYPVKDFHRQLISHTKHQRMAIAAPRGFAKSTYFSFFYPLYLALEKPGTKIMLVSATSTFAQKWVTRIRTELDGNPTIVESYGKQEGKPWTTEELHLKNGSILLAKGAEGQIRGERPDVIIADDLENDEMVVSVERRNKFDEWFWESLVGTMMPWSQIIVIGTLLHPESFLSEIVNETPEPRHGWESTIYRAICEDGSALWPDMWPLNILDDYRRERGTYAFEQEYMNNPIPDDLRQFQKKWFHYFTDLPKQMTIFVTVDPAIETHSKADETAIVTCGIDPLRNIFVLETLNKRLLPSETIDTLFKIYERWESKGYKVSGIGIEIEGFQRKLKYDFLEERKRRGVHPRVFELKSGGRRKGLRVEGLQPFYEDGKIHHREQLRGGHLETQLLRFPSPRCRDDLPDALAYQLDIIKAAPKDVERINPKSFLAVVEARRRRAGKAGIWGQKNVRKR